PDIPAAVSAGVQAHRDRTPRPLIQPRERESRLVNTVDAVKQVLLRSGAAWVLWLLAACLVITIAIIVERCLFYRARNCDLRALARRLGTCLAERNVAA